MRRPLGVWMHDSKIGRPAGVSLSSLSLMRQKWTVRRLKTVKFRIESMVPSGGYLDACQMGQIDMAWPPKRESQTDICSQRSRRDLIADINEKKCIKISVMGWTKSPWGFHIFFFGSEILKYIYILSMSQVLMSRYVWMWRKAKHYCNIIWC